MWVGFSRGDLLLMWMWGSHDHTERSSHCLHTISEGKPPHLHIHLSNQTPSTHGRSKQPPRRRYATATTAAGGRNKARVVGNIAGRRGEGWGSQEEEGRAEEEKGDAWYETLQEGEMVGWVAGCIAIRGGAALLVGNGSRIEEHAQDRIHTCVYCRRSHMTCDDGRPCQRCIKRSIGHLCHDEPKVPPPPHSQGLSGGNTYLPMSVSPDALRNQTANFPSLPMQTFGQITTGPLTFASEHGGNEFTVISDFLESLEETNGIFTLDGSPPVVNNTEKFFLTAADPSDGRLEDRLTEVINAKYEAGFLKPYNYVNGYARLQRYMDTNILHPAYDTLTRSDHPSDPLPFSLCPHPPLRAFPPLYSSMSNQSRQRILNVMGTFRPAFRAVAQSLTDIDLILVEEAFERLLLDYDRVFSSMGVPACLWRRTGEIYKGNKEFAALVDVPIDTLREVSAQSLLLHVQSVVLGSVYPRGIRLAWPFVHIRGSYLPGLMAEQSAVNYWEKYGNIAFDAGQKAVLTSCLLRNPNPESVSVISCCFSFTIRRDKYNMYVSSMFWGPAAAG
ncbi:hypothetical protein BC936DRAFT_147043 [Jimgerdemannia flammicorona]|uniref:Zn(2)-C6 fungal-type domain-containing protein n=1 Tax=Jimgerdemannia flammicorona TaxID=994334 RepID=A0A433D6C5_9FUNG|nr:hypothetical protein BC936DRAFT_147043 [Jimgerdemannia flammicorona]